MCVPCTNIEICGIGVVQKDRIFKACQHFMKPIIRFLLRNRISWDEFSELSKDIYVDVARQDYGIQGRPTNNSRVAMMTGLSRREVAQIRDRLLDDEAGPEGLHGNRISQVLTGWHVDSEFVNASGQPKDLPATGPSGSLSALFKRYAGDLPHSALRKEMLQEGLIEQRKNGDLRVLQREYTYQALDPEIVDQMSVSLHDHAATLEHNLNGERQSPPRFEALADNVHVSSRSVRAFGELVESRGLGFLNEMDAWLSEHEIDDGKSAGGREVRVGVGVYLIHDDS